MSRPAPENASQMWVIYERPRDYPEHYVARLFYITTAGILAEPTAHIADTLEDARLYVPQWAVRLPRYPNDEPQIVESWI